MARTRALSLWLPVVVLAAVIFAFSSLPGPTSELDVWGKLLRKAAHVVEYATLGFLLMRALRAEAWAFAAGLAYAVSDELHQRFVPRRMSSPRDVAIDAVGLTLGLVAFRVWLRRQGRALESG